MKIDSNVGNIPRIRKHK